MHTRVYGSILLTSIAATLSCQRTLKGGPTRAENQPGAQEKTYLGYAQQSGGRPFLGYFQKGHLVALPPWTRASNESFRQAADSVLRAFAPGDEFVATSDLRAGIRVRIDSVNAQADYYESVFSVSYPGIKKSPAVVLFTTNSSVPIAVVPHHPGRLTESEGSLLKARIDTLWRLALREREPQDSLARYELGPPQVHDVGGLLAILFPIVIAWPGNDRDDRPSAFFIYSRPERRIIFAAFGHPEWAPADSSVILAVRPQLYFRIAADSTIYFFGDHDGGWESSAMAIYELKSGRAVVAQY